MNAMQKLINWFPSEISVNMISIKRCSPRSKMVFA